MVSDRTYASNLPSGLMKMASEGGMSELYGEFALLLNRKPRLAWSLQRSAAEQAVTVAPWAPNAIADSPCLSALPTHSWLHPHPLQANPLRARTVCY